jgi:hypothetical protein
MKARAIATPEASNAGRVPIAELRMKHAVDGECSEKSANNPSTLTNAGVIDQEVDFRTPCPRAFHHRRESLVVCNFERKNKGVAFDLLGNPVEFVNPSSREDDRGALRS